MTPTRRSLLLLALAALPLAAGCTALGLYPRERAFTAAELQERLARRFPWKRSFALLEIELANPLVRLEGTENRIATTFDAGVRSPLLREALTGKLAISGTPRYAADARAFMLGDLRVDSLDFPRLPRGVAEEIRRLAGALATDVLGEAPLYTLRPEDGRWYGAELEPESVRVEGDRLVLRVKPR